MAVLPDGLRVVFDRLEGEVGLRDVLAALEAFDEVNPEPPPEVVLALGAERLAFLLHGDGSGQVSPSGTRFGPEPLVRGGAVGGLPAPTPEMLAYWGRGATRLGTPC